MRGKAEEVGGVEGSEGVEGVEGVEEVEGVGGAEGAEGVGGVDMFRNLFSILLYLLITIYYPYLKLPLEKVHSVT